MKNQTKSPSLKTLSRDVAYIKKTMVTKDDLKGFPTRSDPQGFATKDDLKNFATKDELNAQVSKLVEAILKNQQDIQFLKETSATKDDVRLILNRIDHFTHKVEVFDRKVLVHDHRINELEAKTHDHDKRIARLENV